MPFKNYLLSRILRDGTNKKSGNRRPGGGSAII
jgi:hypothetical protein